MDLDFAKELYFREFESKVQQDARIGVYVALLSAVGGVLAFLLRAAWPLDHFSISYWSMAFSLVALGCYFLAIVWVLRATVGYTYEKLASPERLLSHWQHIQRYYQENPGASGNPHDDFADFLLRKFVSAASRNATNNLQRSARFYVAACLLVWVVVFAALGGSVLGVSHLLSAVR